MADITRYWYRDSLHFFTFLLLPFSWLFAGVVALRRWLYRVGVFKVTRFEVPVIVVGNITVGGTGKTPFVVWLVNELRRQGLRPGVVMRGVGAVHRDPFSVQADMSAAVVGDEAAIIARRAQCPLVIGVDRVAAVRALLSQYDCNVVVSDDGLQHYAMGRQFEVVLIDGIRQLGNRQLLPAGPLREPISRLASVDLVLQQGGENPSRAIFNLVPIEFVQIKSGKTLPLQAFHGKTLHAVAGIGHPEKFFATLQQLGCVVVPHIFPDHHPYQSNEVLFSDDLPVVMTEKDAVKCELFATEQQWYLRVAVEVNANFSAHLLALLNQKGVTYEI